MISLYEHGINGILADEMVCFCISVLVVGTIYFFSLIQFMYVSRTP